MTSDDPGTRLDEAGVRERIASHPIEGSPRTMRAAFERLADLPVDIGDCDVRRRRVAGMEVTVMTPRTGSGLATIVYLHGGGYVFGSPDSHLRLGIELARRSGCELWLPDYPLAPEHPWPAQRAGAVAVMRAAAGDGDAAGSRPVILGGDSAGGHLAIAASLDAPGGMVRGLVLFSPNTLRDPGRSRTRTANADRDAMNEPGQDDALARLAFGVLDADDPAQNLVSADLRSLPPVYLEVGGAEILLDDGLLFAREAAIAGVELELHVIPDAFHMRQLFAQHWHEADASLASAGRWIAQKVQADTGSVRDGSG